MTKKTIWLFTFLVGGYVALQLIADVGAAKIVEVWGINMPAGTFVFALTFTWRDLMHKRLGKTTARAAIVVAALCNLGMVLAFQAAILQKPAVFWPNQEAFAATLGIVWRITIASIVAELVSELIDTEVYHAVAKKATGKWQFLRVLASNAVALPVDSALFGTLAFYGTMPLAAIWQITIGQVLFKALVTAVSLPGIYLVADRPVEGFSLGVAELS